MMEPLFTEEGKRRMEEIDNAPVRRGWGWPLNSKKAHYFIGAESLCRRWLYGGELEEGNDNSPDNCRACAKKLAAQHVARSE
jgi:hypothetical protein